MHASRSNKINPQVVFATKDGTIATHSLDTTHPSGDASGALAGGNRRRSTRGQDRRMVKRRFGKSIAKQNALQLYTGGSSMDDRTWLAKSVNTLLDITGEIDRLVTQGQHVINNCLNEFITTNLPHEISGYAVDKDGMIISEEENQKYIEGLMLNVKRRKLEEILMRHRIQMDDNNWMVFGKYNLLENPPSSKE